MNDSFFKDDYSINSISYDETSDFNSFDLEDEKILNESDDPDIPSTSSRINMVKIFFFYILLFFFF